MNSLTHPYQDVQGGTWLRGNLHAHTTHSDGTRPSQEVIDDYARRGYDYLMISDHDIFTSPEDHAQLDAKGLILIPGNEVSANGPHLLHVGADRLIAPDADRQKVIDEIAESGNGFAIMNHPNWQGKFDHCSMECLERWTGYAGIEIYNGVIGELHGSPYATNKWDMLLSSGRRIWGFANDDSHRAEHVELGWNVVCVRDKSPQAVVEALADGRFYGSTGVAITSIAVDGRHIRIETDNARRITALMQIGRRFAVADASTIEVDVPEQAKYVRFECWGDGERFAWTQPFFTA